MDGCLVPCLHVLNLLLGETLGCLPGGGPVKATDQILAVLPATKSAGALLLCLLVQGLLNGLPNHPACGCVLQS